VLTKTHTDGQIGYFFKMTQQAYIQGSIVAIVTPMLEDGSVDWKGLEKLVEWHIEQGTNSIVAVGTTGEASTLSMAEHAQVIKEIIRVANKRIPIIAGTGANSTHEAIELTKEAKALGADAALLVTPYYNKPTQEGLYQHYKVIAEAVDLPIILYNVPGRTGVDLQNENVIPKQMSEICAVALSGDHTQAEQLNNQVADLHDILFCESNPIPVKWALHEMGLIGTGIRLPLTPLAEQYRTPLREALHVLDAIK